ncbi:hypothetical protein [Methylobacterium organophilum]|uniref:Glycine zipper domain-containing protein n=1 Tax=Methylobacterium organophilum TaxID=410 RepID=A0ABQ4TF91_METOR|nr:hypothetical protein [Methylobacterium organophilum]GJE28795.1 hypothetical protein LKMONMHP_3669 [Methylobacterium organophilum]
MRKAWPVLALVAGLTLTVPGSARAADGTAVGVGTGAVAGALVGGPIGAVVGAVAGGVIGSRSDGARPRRHRRPRYARRAQGAERFGGPRVAQAAPAAAPAARPQGGPATEVSTRQGWQDPR